jgi:cation transport ATPase
LKDEVIAEISRSIDESSDVPMLLAMHILLQNREETVKYKKRLSEDQLTLMKEFPIWALYVNVVGVSE